MTRFKPYGPRGVIMMALSVVAFGRAAAYLVPGRPSFTPSVLVDMSVFLPLYVWGVLWGVTGLALLVYAPRKNQDIGLLAVIPLSTMWALVYSYEAVTRALNEGILHSVGALITASVYMSLAVIVVALTRLINLPRNKGASNG